MPKILRLPCYLLPAVAIIAAVTGIALAQPTMNFLPPPTTGAPAPGSPQSGWPPTDAPNAQLVLPRYQSGTANYRLLPYRPDPGVTPRLAQFPNSSPPSNTWQAPQQAPQQPAAEVFELAQTVARVGDQHIFRGDLVGAANVILIPQLETLPAEELGKIEAAREGLSKQVLQAIIQRKLMYEMFLRSIPADKLEEAQANIAARVPEQFAEQLDEMVEKVKQTAPEEYRGLSRQNTQLFALALIMKELNLNTPFELDLVLRRYDSSLDKQHQIFAEDQLGRQEMFQKARDVSEVTYDDMVAYYQEKIDEFHVATRARWEQVTMKFDSFATKSECGEAIARIGNELFYGAPFKTVAKRSSDGPNAKDGGYHDWTEWGNFNISRELNEAVFSLPKGRLSDILVDAEGLHIVRVIERQDAHIIPFVDAQATIKTGIQAQRRNKAITDYLVELQDEIPVWTIYDEPRDSPQIANPPRTRNDRISR